MGDACAVPELQGKAPHIVGWCLPWLTAHIYADGEYAAGLLHVLIHLPLEIDSS